MTVLRHVPIGVMFIVASVVVLVPVATVTTFPIQDLPNHVARAYIISNLNESPILKNYYEISNLFVANLGTEAILLPLSYIFQWNMAVKFLVAVALIIVPAGVYVLNYVIFKKVHAHTILIFIFVYNYSFICGFLSYIISVGFFLLLFSLWITSAHWPLIIRTGVFSVLATILMFLHLFGLGLYGLTVMAYETGIAVKAWRADQRFSARAWLIAAMQFVVPLGLFLVLSTTADQAESTSWSQLADKWHYYQKIFIFADLIPNYTTDPGERSHTILFMIIIALCGIGLMLKIIRIDPRLRLPIISLCITFVFLPKNVFSALNVDDRLPIAIAAISLAATRLEERYHAIRTGMLIGSMAILVFLISNITRQWKEYDVYYEEYITAIKKLPHGARLMAAIGYVGPANVMKMPPLIHIGNMIINLREGFFPTVFSHPGQQPITLSTQYAIVRDKYSRVDYRNDELDDRYLTTVRPLFDHDILASYDYFLWVRPELFDVTPPKVLEPVFRGSDFIMFKIMRDRE